MDQNQSQPQLQNSLPGLPLPPSAFLRALADQYNMDQTLKHCKIEPSFGSQLDKSGKMEQWVDHSQQPDISIENHGIVASRLSTSINSDMVCNRSYQVDTSSGNAPLDLESIWNY